jgi:hypothetical protein
VHLATANHPGMRLTINWPLARPRPPGHNAAVPPLLRPAKDPAKHITLETSLMELKNESSAQSDAAPDGLVGGSAMNSTGNSKDESNETAAAGNV